MKGKIFLQKFKHRNKHVDECSKIFIKQAYRQKSNMQCDTCTKTKTEIRDKRTKIQTRNTNTKLRLKYTQINSPTTKDERMQIRINMQKDG